ncbi:MAG: hypothetical protein LUO89_04560, partial [Methanothrix sp.]|nr:hypothetical protein [Methanothrix sp.]
MKTNRKAGGVLISMIGVFISLSFLTSFSDAAIPQKMNYQGYLTSAAGVPVNGTVQMVFSIYNVPSGGTELWTETQNVAVTHGVYNVEFGEVTPVNLAFDVQYYLGIKVGTDPEMTPRIPLTSVGYAFRAQTVEMIGSHTHSGTDITSGTVSEPRIDSAIARTLALNAHTSNMNNPHATTATQVGAAPSVHSHSGGDITAGIVAEARIDPLIARDSEVSSSISTHTANASAHHTRYTNAEAVAAVKAADGSGSGLDADLLDGLHASALASSTHNHDAAYVNVTGDTMTGALNLPSNGLAVGTNQLVVSGGRVGVGTAGPSEQLEITGNLKMPMTTASGGMIKAGADRFIHNYGGIGNLFAGVNAGNLSMSGVGNTGIGASAVQANTTGERNTGVGATALMNNTAGKDNTAVGMNALTLNTTAGGNVAVGTAALYVQSYNNGGTAWNSNNTAVGYYALSQNNPTSTSTGFHNSAFGASALFLNTTGYYNTASGAQALYSNTTGHENTASGDQALYYNTTGNENTASGAYALYSNTIADYNTASGAYALYSNTTGHYNTASGAEALDSNTTGDDNTASGARALLSNTTGGSNTASGAFALRDNTIGSNNTASGVEALYSNTTGSNNTASGEGALYYNKTGSSNTASGAIALFLNTASGNTASGA